MAMPDTIGGMGGAGITLNPRANSAAGAYKRKKNCKCWINQIFTFLICFKLLFIYTVS